ACPGIWPRPEGSHLQTRPGVVWRPRSMFDYSRCSWLQIGWTTRFAQSWWLRSRSVMANSNHLHSNRDLYLFVANLGERYATSEQWLEDYVRVLGRLGSSRRELAGLPLSSFAGLLEAALQGEPPPFDPRWSQQYESGKQGLAGYQRWECTILDQIV